MVLHEHDKYMVVGMRFRRCGRDWCHGQMDAGNIAVGAAVIGLVGEAVGAAVAGVRRVGERAVGVEPERAMRRAGDQHGGERVAVGVGVVGQDALSGGDRRVVTRRGRCSCRPPPPGRYPEAYWCHGRWTVATLLSAPPSLAL